MKTMTDEYIRKQDVVDYCKALMNAELVQNTDDWGYGKERYNQTQVILVFIENRPPADVAPVVHSRWSDEMERVDTYHPFAGFETDYYHRCLDCGHRGKGFSWNFCPYCGAKMDEEE